MKADEVIQAEEERIRQWVRELPDDKRLAFFKQAEKSLKDPDTYATLNYLFIAGLHHFYLGKWIRGSINLLIFVAGVLCIFTGLTGLGILILIAISAVELKALFKAQLVIQDYNNGVMQAIYREIVR
ncbi:MAG TPA: TM2 domain-containing protein [Nitrosomonas sp.]|nr:TM2 domain-containing protein [Nitrosomonas sp.]HQV88420.1 TM2 domain-containing protein [Nitrosomonas sp.]